MRSRSFPAPTPRRNRQTSVAQERIRLIISCAHASLRLGNSRRRSTNRASIFATRRANWLRHAILDRPKADEGRSVVHSAWTPDSNFFVFSTQSSGGHSPWHWNTYFYSRKKNKFALLDDTIGAVIKSNFKVKAPDIVEATVQGTASDPSDIQTGHVVTRHLGSL
jgi:hypothetical protein